MKIVMLEHCGNVFYRKRIKIRIIKSGKADRNFDKASSERYDRPNRNLELCFVQQTGLHGRIFVSPENTSLKVCLLYLLI